ncbi:MAG: Crp/Fnr family transcriptional regulator [Pseudomonadota bacterium]
MTEETSPALVPDSERAPDLVQSLDGVPLLASLSAEERAALARQCAWRHLGADEVITDPSDESGNIFFLIRGRARIINHTLLGNEVRLADVQEGAYFGELSAFDHGPRTATVLTALESVVAAMPREVFFDTISQNPRVLGPILENLARMVRRTNEKVIEQHLL